jgi:hypothetical protein
MIGQRSENPGVVDLQTEERMIEYNTPIATIESDWKHSRWGIISLAITLLFILAELPNVSLFIPSLTFETFFLNYFPIAFWLWPLFPISVILATIGFVHDQKKIYSIWSLSMESIFLVFCIGLILYAFSQIDG